MKNEINYVWKEKKRTLFGLPLSFTTYFLTDTKIITRTGFLSVEEDEFELYKVTDKKLKLSFMQRMFGCGVLHIYVKDVDTPVKTLGPIKNPRAVADLIDEHVNAQKDKYRIRGRDMTAAYDESYTSDCDCADSDIN